jgi:putative N6-adenine-specific DNA methylase
MNERMNNMLNLVATAAFGIEAVVKRELEHMGIAVMSTENGRIHFEGSVETMIKVNLNLRSADRVYVQIGIKEQVTSFDELFDWIKTLPLETYLDVRGRFIVDAKTVKSALHSPRDIQKISKKALIDRLKEYTPQNVFKEDGPRHRLQVAMFKDTAEMLLDTSGDGLHKRGYRSDQGEAPLKETLAAALIQLSFYGENRVLYDPFCGSGTIPIEAAMMCRNIAPGLNRHFDFEHFIFSDALTLKKARKEAYMQIKTENDCKIIASDADFKMIPIAKENAENAGVDDAIHFETARFEHRTFDIPYSMIITDPPYGERIKDDDIKRLYESIGKTMKAHKTMSFYILSGLMGAENAMKSRAKKTRVLFNGDMKVRYYMYPGPKPAWK